METFILIQTTCFENYHMVGAKWYFTNRSSRTLKISLSTNLATLNLVVVFIVMWTRCNHLVKKFGYSQKTVKHSFCEKSFHTYRFELLLWYICLTGWFRFVFSLFSSFKHARKVFSNIFFLCLAWDWASFWSVSFRSR